MKISTILTLGPGLTIKREKGDDGDARTLAHLKFTGLVVKREEVNELAGQQPGWCETCFYDELGAPLGDWTLTLADREFTVSGEITDHGGRHRLRIAEAQLDKLAITFTSIDAVLSGQLSWLVAGDEAGDAEPLLGQTCAVALTLTDGGQQDMLKERAA